MNSNEQVIEDLVSKLLADELSPSEREELNRLLQSDSEARQVYHDRMWMETGLREYYAGGTSVVVPSASRIPILARLVSSWPAISALAVLLALVVGATWMLNSKGDDDATVAWLEYRDKMHIDGADVGLPLKEQTLRFEDGQAVIRFLSGARLMFSGPGEIGITGPNSATLTEGSVTVRVDEGGEGFQLKTPNGLITDLGTQFGVHVSNGEDRVHVIDGKITVERDGVIQELSKGQAVNSRGNVEFFRPEFFPEIGSTRESTRKTTWLDELGVKYFHQGWGRARINRSVDGGELTTSGQHFTRGIGTHAYSDSVYEIPDGTICFRGLVGISDEVINYRYKSGESAKCEFLILGDEKVLWRSGVVRAGDPIQRFNVQLQGVKKMRLVVKPCGDQGGDHANWLEASFTHTKKSPELIQWYPDFSAHILTPKAGPAPLINGASIVGGTPGRSFLFRIPTSGQRPISFRADDLPKGITLDSEKGILQGTVPQAGEYKITLHASNDFGQDDRVLRLVSGDNLALTPPMGWNSWRCWGEAVSAEKIRRSAKALVDKGLADYGWTYISIDDCWQGVREEPSNALQGKNSFRDMKSLCDDIHDYGLKVGIYSTPWISTYSGFHGGSSPNPTGYAHELYIPQKDRFQPSQYFGRHPTAASNGLNRVGPFWFGDKDAKQWADWGIDLVKFGFNFNDLPTLKRLRDDLDQTDRDIVFWVSSNREEIADPKVADIANMWSARPGIQTYWNSMITKGFHKTDWNNPSQPGHWNNMDVLHIGSRIGHGGGVFGLRERVLEATRFNANEQYSQFSLWCLLSSPLILSCDIETMDDFTVSLLTNREVIAVNQDPTGSSALPVDAEKSLWLKPLEDGSFALGIFNFDEEAKSIDVNLSELELPDGSWNIRDLWRQKDLGTFDNKFSTTVESHGVVLIKLSQ